MPCVNCQASTNVPPGGLSPDDICNGKYITSDCVIYSGVALSTIDIENGDTFTTIINNVNNVVNNIVTGAFTADNGLTNNVPTNVQLGGDLIKNTTIDTKNYNYIFTNSTNRNTTLQIYQLNTLNSNVFPALVSQAYNGLAGEFIGGYLSTNNASIQPIIEIRRTTSNPLVGTYDEIGGSIDFLSPLIPNFLAPAVDYSNRIASRWQNSNALFPVSRFELWGMNVSARRNLAVVGSGKLILDQYGIGTFVNTPTYGLGVDATGNVVETVGIVEFITVLTSVNIMAGDTVDITQLPTLPAGYAWEVVSCCGRLVGATTPYDGSPVVRVKANSSAKGQYNTGNLLANGVDDFIFLERAFETDSNVVVESDKMVIEIDNSSIRTGDGTLTVYGTARIITL